MPICAILFVGTPWACCTSATAAAPMWPSMSLSIGIYAQRRWLRCTVFLDGNISRLRDLSTGRGPTRWYNTWWASSLQSIELYVVFATRKLIEGAGDLFVTSADRYIRVDWRRLNPHGGRRRDICSTCCSTGSKCVSTFAAAPAVVRKGTDDDLRRTALNTSDRLEHGAGSASGFRREMCHAVRVCEGVSGSSGQK